MSNSAACPEFVEFRRGSSTLAQSQSQIKIHQSVVRHLALVGSMMTGLVGLMLASCGSVSSLFV
jgi:hypothetical protein